MKKIFKRSNFSCSIPKISLKFHNWIFFNISSKINVVYTILLTKTLFRARVQKFLRSRSRAAI